MREQSYRQICGQSEPKLINSTSIGGYMTGYGLKAVAFQKRLKDMENTANYSLRAIILILSTGHGTNLGESAILKQTGRCGRSKGYWEMQLIGGSKTQ